MGTKTLIGELSENPKNTDAWAQLADHLRPVILEWCIDYCSYDRDAAEDVAQDVLMDIPRKAQTFRPDEGAARAWLRVVVRHACCDVIRKEKRRSDRGSGDTKVGEVLRNVPDDALADQVEASVNRLILEETLVEIRDELGANGSHVDVFLAMDRDGMSGPEVAAKFDLQVHEPYRIRKKIRDMLSRRLKSPENG